MRILGIDPGLRLTGYGCIDLAAAAASRTTIPATIVEAGVIRLSRASGSSRAAITVSQRLDELETDFKDLLARTNPTVVAVEAVFAHAQYPMASIVMAHARGVLLLAIRRAGVQLVELKPAEVKKALTGNGQAPKDQMQRAIQACFNLPDPPRPADVADALAIALVGARRAAVAAAIPEGESPTRSLGTKRGNGSRRLPAGLAARIITRD